MRSPGFGADAEGRERWATFSSRTTSRRHAGGGPLLELRRLARNGNEGAARLLAGDDLGRAFGGDRGLEQIIGFDAVGQHGCS